MNDSQKKEKKSDTRSIKLQDMFGKKEDNKNIVYEKTEKK